MDVTRPVVLYNVELFRSHEGTFHMLWVQEVERTRYARFKLYVPQVHGNLLRVLDSEIWIAYAKRHLDKAVRIETDGKQDYYGPRGPGGRVNSKEDRSKKANATNGSKGGKARQKSMVSVRRQGNTDTGPDA